MFKFRMWKSAIIVFVLANTSDNSYQYILIQLQKTWSEAQAYCRSNYADLVTINSDITNNDIYNLANGRAVWIGLYNHAWKWSDGTAITFLNPHIDVLNCMALCYVSPYIWHSRYCSDVYTFFCYDVKQQASITDTSGVQTLAPTTSIVQNGLQGSNIAKVIVVLRVGIQAERHISLDEAEMSSNIILSMIHERFSALLSNINFVLYWKTNDGNIFQVI
ncbi:macrophage mannose receptor 1-like isoform X2 [Polypterus senegalus]|uniref:macrophage mannose receptor 1-like isoform X2 n=1 Tax=Polypterus senegalus TaxID=55291 RepID=UPI0019666E85|nr:macrophage mannose receptor 1-like isoform X2 [Polypterus senegalus]